MFVLWLFVGTLKGRRVTMNLKDQKPQTENFFFDVLATVSCFVFLRSLNIRIYLLVLNLT